MKTFEHTIHRVERGPERPLITIVICTFNRAARLQRLLESVRALREPRGTFEIIVVDNNSADETMRVVGDYIRNSGGRARYVFERAPGLSNARNRGVREAKGRYIAFTDDDTLVSPDWLIEIENAFALFPDAAAIGGKVTLEWSAKPPAWLTADLHWMLAHTDHGEQVLRLDRPTLSGANFACNVAALDGPKPFDPNLGRIGNTLRGGEETEFLQTILSQGRAVYYVPSMVIRHVIEQDRLVKGYFRKLMFDEGRGYVGLRSVRAAAHVGMGRMAARAGGRAARLWWNRKRTAAAFRCFYFAGVAAGFLLSGKAPLPFRERGASPLRVDRARR